MMQKLIAFLYTIYLTLLMFLFQIVNLFKIKNYKLYNINTLGKVIHILIANNENYLLKRVCYFFINLITNKDLQTYLEFQHMLEKKDNKPFILEYICLEPIEIEMIYFYLWFTLIKSKPFTNLGYKIMFISRALIETEPFVGRVLTEWISLHPNFLWKSDIQFDEFYYHIIRSLEYIKKTSYSGAKVKKLNISCWNFDNRPEDPKIINKNENEN